MGERFFVILIISRLDNVLFSLLVGMTLGLSNTAMTPSEGGNGFLRDA